MQDDQTQQQQTDTNHEQTEADKPPAPKQVAEMTPSEYAAARLKAFGTRGATLF